MENIPNENDNVSDSENSDSSSSSDNDSKFSLDDSSYISSDETYKVKEIFRDLIDDEKEELNEKNKKEDQKSNDSNWTEFTGRQKSFPFTGQSGLQRSISNTSTPLDIFLLFIDANIIQHIVTETNNYAHTKREKVPKWTPTNHQEIKKFLGLIIYMSQTPMDDVPGYWRHWRDELDFRADCDLPRRTMPLRRFKHLFNMIRFSDCRSKDSDERFKKIQPVVEMLDKNFKALHKPGEDILFDQIFIPWRRGETKFGEYIPNKACEYGLKFYRLSAADGYTCAINIDTCQEGQDESFENICLKLTENFLNEGRTLYVGNAYVNYNLVKQFLDRKTHVIGVPRKRDGSFPKAVTQARLNRGEIVSREDENGVVILKWRTVYDAILSTKHAPIAVEIKSRVQPLVVIEYDKKMDVVGRLCEEISTNYLGLRKALKYKKLCLDLLLGIVVINSWIIYKYATNNRIDIYTFRKRLMRQILNDQE